MTRPCRYCMLLCRDAVWKNSLGITSRRKIYDLGAVVKRRIPASRIPQENQVSIGDPPRQPRRTDYWLGADGRLLDVRQQADATYLAGK